jgi:hypothetical protein
MLRSVGTQGDSEKPSLMVLRAKPTNISLKAILTPYGISQFISALVGGFGEFRI